MKICKQGHTKDWYPNGKCAACARNRAKVRYSQSRETILAERAAWRRTDAGKAAIRNQRFRVKESAKRLRIRYLSTARGNAISLLGLAKRRARASEILFTLRVEDILPALEAGVCEATGIPFSRYDQGRSPFTPSLDRRIPEKGYVPGNVQVVVWALNAMRGDWGDAVLLRVAKALEERAKETEWLG